MEALHRVLSFCHLLLAIEAADANAGNDGRACTGEFLR